MALKFATALFIFQLESVTGYRKKRQNNKLAQEQTADQQVIATSLHAVLDKDGDGNVDDLECNGANSACAVVNGACVCSPGSIARFYKDKGSSDAKQALVQVQSSKAGCDTQRCVEFQAEGETLCACSQPTTKDDEGDGKGAALVQTSPTDTNQLLSANCADWDAQCEKQPE